MRSALARISAGYVAVFVLGIAVALIAAPLWKSAIIGVNQAAFSDLTYKCDLAMRGHMIAKLTVGQRPSDTAVSELKAAEIELIVCQDYDLMRKMLMRWGLSDNELSEMALVAIESRASDLQEVVRIHEIRY